MPPTVAMRPIRGSARRCRLVDVGLIDVVGPDGVEGGDVARHARHEAGQQGGQAEAKDAGWEIVQQHDGDGEVVVETGLPLASSMGCR